MAVPAVFFALFFALFVSRFDPSACQSLKASITCLDCDHDFDYSGIEVAVKCDKVKKLSVVSTESDGSFAVEELPSNPAPPVSCLAKLVGGPSPLYVPKSNTVSKIVPTTTNKELNAYTISTPLLFYTARPSTLDSQFGASKNIDIPLPPEWGLAPSSYYVPFFPIIGIP